jgi:protein SCO1/2
MFVYYECPSLCSLFLNGVVSSLKTLPWTAGKEFNVVTISIDPSETPELAQKKKASYLAVYQRTGAESGWRFLVNDEQKPRSSPAESVNAGKLADSAGFRYRFDKESNQFAHPTALVVLTPAGKIARYLYGINFKAKDLRLALTEAGEGKTGGIIDRVLLYCYHYDSSLRGYSLSAERLMKVAGAITVVACALLIVFLTKASRRSGHV